MGHLTKKQRYTIPVMKQQGCNNSLISLTIRRDKSVVSRELRRGRDLRNGRYNAGLAQRKYESRMREKSKLIRFTEAVCERVEALLQGDYSPEQVAGRCRLEGSDVSATSASTSMCGWTRGSEETCTPTCGGKEALQEARRSQRQQWHHQGQGRHRGVPRDSGAEGPFRRPDF